MHTLFECIVRHNDAKMSGLMVQWTLCIQYARHARHCVHGTINDTGTRPQAQTFYGNKCMNLTRVNSHIAHHTSHVTPLALELAL